LEAMLNSCGGARFTRLENRFRLHQPVQKGHVRRLVLMKESLRI
jgi:hypothetical protein